MRKLVLVLAGCANGDIPVHTLNNGVDLPMISIGTWQYDEATAKQVVETALQVGFNHIDTANDYNNQRGVGAALQGVDRSSYFLTTKVPPGDAQATKKALQDNLDQLGLDYVDLVLVHFEPMFPFGKCGKMQQQWSAMEEFYKAGKAKAIGVSNYCPSSLECIAQTAEITPAVNQVKFHVGMGTDPIGLKSYCDAHGIHMQAYSPLGNNGTELITGDLVTGIGNSHNKTGAQVSLRWVHENGVSLATKTTKQSHMEEDLDIFNFELLADEKQTLDDATSPADRPSFTCTKLEYSDDTATCKGTDDPTPGDYHGKVGIPGLADEDVTITIASYADGAAVVNFVGTGVEAFTCSGKQASISGNDITLEDSTDCLPDGIALQNLQYCSADDTIHLQIKDFGDHIPLPIPMTLKRVSAVIV